MGTAEMGTGGAGTRQRPLTGVWRLLLIAGSAGAVALSVNRQFSLGFFSGTVLLDTETIYLTLALTFPLVFVLFPAGRGAAGRHLPWADRLLCLAGYAALFWLAAHIRRSAASGWDFLGAPTPVLVAGGVLWLLLLEALRRTGGAGLTLVVGTLSVYPIFAGASWLGPLSGIAVSPAEAVSFHALSGESVLGFPIRAFVTVVIGFLVFGTALSLTGAGSFFIDLAFAVFGRFRGGAAKVSIISSAFLGMMSGSIVSNVVSTGSMTIPLMKRGGFRPVTAGAVESCASTGAVLAPPVMGATAFVMAELLNVSYAEVALAATIPAGLFFLALYIQIDAHAGRHGLAGIPPRDLPRLGPTLRKGWYFLLVIVLLVAVLLVLRRESHAPFYATLLLLALNQAFNRDGRWRLADIPRFFETLGRTLVEIVALLAGCGLLIGAFAMTGVVSSLANDLLRLADGQVLGLLAMCALTSLVLGLGLTTTACYIFLALLVAPALERLGLNRMAVHMFIFYWGMLSSITPPVAIAAFAAAGIAGARPAATGLEAMKLGALTYVIPFFFVLDPALLLQGDAPWPTALLHLATILPGAVLIGGGLQGYLPGMGTMRGRLLPDMALRALAVIAGLAIALPENAAAGILKTTTLPAGCAALIALVVLMRIDHPRRAPGG